MKFQSLFLGLLFATFVSSAPILLPRSATLAVPTDDPFYQAPSGYEDEAVGTVLRTRKLQDAFGLITFELHVSEVHQVLVVSEDTFKNKIVIMSTVFVPFNADPSKLVSYHMAEDTASPNCAPSYAMQLESSAASWITPQVELLLVNSALKEGYYVVVPDHEGPKATFVAGYSAGYAVLNTVRGVLSTGNDTGIDPDAEVAFWGYSGGGFTTAWASSLHPTYAPEINLVGASMGGVPVDLHHVANYTMGTLFAGFIISAILGLSHEYPDLDNLLTEYTKSESILAHLKDAENDCLLEILSYYAFATWDNYFTDGEAVLDLPLVVNLTAENSIMNNGGIPTVPIFAYHSQMDEIIPVDDMDDLYDYYCGKGVVIDYHRGLYSGHIITAVTGAGLALNFIKDRFNKVPVSDKCSKTTTAFEAFDPDALPGLKDILIADVDFFLGDDMGPDSPSTGNTTTTTASGTTGIVNSVLNGISSLVSNLINPENPESVTPQYIYDHLGETLSSAWGAVTAATSFVSGIFGGSDSSNSTSGGLVSSLLSEGASLASGLLGSDSSSNSTSGGLVSSLLSEGESLASDLLGSDSSTNNTSSSGGLLSTLGGLASSLFDSGSSSNSSSSVVSSLLSAVSSIL
ncbi:putative lipase 1 [[Candida] railenensis]|uniref:Lipase 1 n=1 Tax=[Candida] railenensis TaxID=45579 RepID=A0A9P0QTL7_9ASCO|nr:putative lipase 1 [[Candida] railenensis]